MPAVQHLLPVRWFRLHRTSFLLQACVHLLHTGLHHLSAEGLHLHKWSHRMPAGYRLPHTGSHHLPGISFPFYTLSCCCLQYQHPWCSCLHQMPGCPHQKYTVRYHSEEFLLHCLTGKHHFWHLQHLHQTHYSWKQVCLRRHKEFWFHHTVS